MQYFDTFCRGLYKGFLTFGRVMILPSTLGTILAALLWGAFLFLMPVAVVGIVCGAIAGWFIGGKLGDLQTYLSKRFD